MKKIIALVAAGLLVAGCSPKDKDIAIVTAFAPDPPQKGIETVTVTLKDGTGAAVEGATVKIGTTMPLMSMNGPSVSAHDNGDGTYSARLNLQYATSWNFAISAKEDGKIGISQVKEDVK